MFQLIQQQAVQLIQQQAVQLLAVALLTMVLSLVLRRIAFKMSLVDMPSARKNHKNATPLIGGVCIFIACGLSLFVFGHVLSQDSRTLFGAASLFLLLGVLDDLFDFKARVKLLCQLTISYMFIASSGLQISNLGHLFWLENTFELGFLSIPFTILAIVGLTNAFNMMDGCDGLAASMAGLAILALLYFGSSQFEFLTQIFLLFLVMSISVFLVFNFSEKAGLKIFLGDGGSLFLGFIVSALLIEFAEGNETYRPSMVLWFVAVPVFDFSTVVVRRLLLGRKIMSADRSHIHHYLLSFGLLHFQATMLILFMAVLLLCLGGFLQANYPHLSLFTFIGLFIVYLSLRLLNRRN